MFTLDDSDDADVSDSRVEVDGNTNSSTSRAKTEKRLRWKNYFCTLKEDESNEFLISDFLEKNGAERYAFQLEEGEGGFRHWQIAVEFERAVYTSKWKRMWPSIHLENTRNLDASLRYCSKEDTRARGAWIFPKPVSTISEMRPWQEQLGAVLGEQNDRQITWIVNKNGGIGKTAWAKYMCVHYGAMYLSSGAGKDLLFGVSRAMRKCLYIIDYPRCNDGKFSYMAIEKIKDGIFFSAKYESAMQLMDSPKIVVFSNQYPERDKLTADRWDVYRCEDAAGDLRRVAMWVSDDSKGTGKSGYAMPATTRYHSHDRDSDEV